MANSPTLSFLLLFMISSPIPSLSKTPCNPDDQKTLVAVFEHLYGPNYSSYLKNVKCCAWGTAVFCDSNGRVINFGIHADSNLNSTIPAALGDLPFLQIIGFRRVPNLTGTIPSTLTKLTRLSFLDLIHNGLSGPIPSFLSNITSLTYLRLARNRFSGTIPASLSTLPNLSALHLERNHLTGTIPESFGSFPKDSPPDLYLSRNSLSGPIPAALGVPNWVTIDLSRNQLTGDASVLFGASKPTRQIDISRNKFRFDLTGAAFPVGLMSLDMNNNAITGSIPAQINSVSGLQLFNVSYNSLCGAIPAGPVTAMFDQSAYLPNKCLCGAPLPAC